MSSESNTPGNDNSQSSNSELSAEEHAEKLRARHEAYETFRREFAVEPHYGVISTTVENVKGGTDRVEVYLRSSVPTVESIDLDREVPVRFIPTTYHLEFRRFRPQSADIPERTQPSRPSSIFFDFGDEDSSSSEELAAAEERRSEDTSERIQVDLRAKFYKLGVSDIPLEPYTRRLISETCVPEASAAHAEADVLMPLYRSLENERLLTDPTVVNSGYLQVATRRQHVYEQLTGLLREARMSPAEAAKFIMEGVFDSGHIAGVPIFSDERGNKYVVIDYSFSGYDEQHPEGTDFSGSYSQREYSEIDQILNKAETLGYDTHYENRGVSGGTHQHWDWHGIKIEDFDKENPENNLPKVLKILQDVGVNPKEAANPNPSGESDLYMR